MRGEHVGTCTSAFACACTCREREREKVCVCVCVYIVMSTTCTYVCVFVRMHVHLGSYTDTYKRYVHACQHVDLRTRAAIQNRNAGIFTSKGVT